MTLREVILAAQAGGTAVGHFNVSDSNQLKAIAEAAKETGLPVIAGLSEGEREFFPLAHARALADQYRTQGVHIYINADHTYSIEKVQRALSAGVDMVVVDGAKLDFDGNVSLLSASVKYARASGRDVVVEGELGYIGTSSTPLNELPEGVVEAKLTTAKEAKRLVDATGIDCLAPAVGNVHGMLKSTREPRLHPKRAKDIAAAAGVPLVLHGASGNTDEDVLACIAAGVAVVHINTELRVLYRDSLKASLEGEETTPYKFLEPAVRSMKAYVARKLLLFAGK